MDVSINEKSITIDFFDTILMIDLNVEKDYKIKELEDGYCITLRDSQYKQQIKINLGMQTNELLNISIRENIDLFYYEYLIEYDLSNNQYKTTVTGSENTILTYNEDSMKSNEGNIIMLDGYIEILPYANRKVEWNNLGFSNSDNGYKKRDIYRLVNINNKD